MAASKRRRRNSHGFRDSFMQPEITSKMLGWEIDTDNGTVFLPITVTGGFNDLLYSKRDFFGRYVEGGDDSINDVESVYGYFGRMSASGYLDSTDWLFSESKKKLMEMLEIQYGDGE